MKAKLLLTTLFIAFCALNINAQSMFWGTSYSGGTNGQGTIFTADHNGGNLHTVYNFVNATGAMPVGRCCLSTNGDIYGCTELGGYGDSCVCYRYSTTTGTFTNIHDLFQYISLGWENMSGMINGPDGAMYGLCALGGANGGGTIFKIDPATDIYTDEFDFVTANGSNAYGTLMVASDGKMYGMSHAGGANNVGVIFSYEPATHTYTKLYVFDNATGASPYYGGLIQGTDGKLYGMTQLGGTSSQGVIFSFDPNSGVYNVLHNFDGTTGGQPYGSLVQATDGNLYGMTYAGGASNLGVVFKYDMTSNTYTDLVDFNGTNGATPKRSLSQGSNGKLFGATYSGGTGSAGVAFSYDIVTNTYTVLSNFSSLTTGSNPNCDLVETAEMNTVGVASNSKPVIGIYPNPATNVLNITGIVQNEVITITDVLGRELSTIKTSQFGKTTLDISNYPSIFFVKLKDGSTTKVVRE
jgi:uncharacterized repeat protein (TIGR03803 family)